MKLKNPIICAIDSNNFEEANNLIKSIKEKVGAIKLGLEFFMAFGINGIKRIIDLYPEIQIFLDLKLHDIPNTVVGALKTIVKIPNIFMTTIHASGEDEMIRRSKEIVLENNSILEIIAVTRLTSLPLDLDKTLYLAEMALRNGADGIVCPAEICKKIREEFSYEYGDFTIVTPGIRLSEGGIVDRDDQKAVSTPRNAISNGSSYLVIGRPITQVQDKSKIIDSILTEVYFK